MIKAPPMLTFILAFILTIPAALTQDRISTLDGKQIFIPKLGSREALSQHSRFSDFIVSMFNRPGDFHGPNCYNTALIASGLFPSEKKRYVSPEEFEAILKNNFIKTPRPQFKDVLVMDAQSSRGHAAFYLGDDLIFHKKSYGTHYHYRITEIKDAGVVEENEWAPGPMDDSSAQMNWPELGRLPMESYRLISQQLPAMDPKFSGLVLKLESLLTNDLKGWAIARKWGITGEYLLQDLLTYARKMKVDKYTEGVLISLKDQIFIFLDEVYFKRARSASRVMEELCVPEQKDQLFELIREFGKLNNIDQQKITATLKKIQEQDKSRCSVRPLQ